jgi:uncharacterized protein (DUF488 family)
MKLVTIGVYGFTEAAFFRALQDAGVDTFCDIRWRRGVRGAEYAFVNSTRLQKRLFQLGIKYLYLRELAPPPALRQVQYDADKQGKVAKRKRVALGEAFVAAYRKERLAAFDSHKFFAQLGAESRSVALFCVERDPAACHRSLLADRLREDLGAQIEIVHLTPGPARP